MGPDDLEFLICQLGWLVQDGIRNADFSDVVEDPGQADSFTSFGIEFHGDRDEMTVSGHILGMVGRVLVLGVEGEREPLDGLDATFVNLLEQHVVFERNPHLLTDDLEQLEIIVRKIEPVATVEDQE